MIHAKLAFAGIGSAIVLTGACLFPINGWGQQCPSPPQAFDIEFVGTSPPFAGSQAILLLRLSDRHIRFTASDTLGETDTQDTSAGRFNCFTGGAPAACGSATDRVVFEYHSVQSMIQGDVLLSTYNRAVVDLVRGASRIRYLLTPCACGSTDAAATTAPAPPAQPSISSNRNVPVIGKVDTATGDPLYVYRVAAADVSANRITALASELFGFSESSAPAISISISSGMRSMSPLAVRSIRSRVANASAAKHGFPTPARCPMRPMRNH
jgi:hypothetical protein